MPQDTNTSGVADLPEALINIAREIEALKRDCGMDPESSIAIQNGRYMAISSKIRALAAGQATAAQQSGAKLNYSVLYVYANQHGIDYNSLCVAVQEASAQPAAPAGDWLWVKLMDFCKKRGFAPANFNDLFEIVDAARAANEQAPAKPDPAYSAACHLATALFKKHFAHLPDFASGQAVWGLCGSTAGVISQIDNMVSGLLQPPTISPRADNKKKDPL